MGAALGPATWLSELFRLGPNHWPLARSIRVALAVGVPLTVGMLCGEDIWGLLIAVGALMPAVTEKENPYSRRLSQIALMVPIALAGYVLAALTPDDVVFQVLVFGALAFVAGVLSTHGSRLSLAAMVMLIFVSLGPHLSELHVRWQFVVAVPVGAAWTASLVAVEWALRRHAPERALLAAYLEAVGERARTGAAAPADPADAADPARPAGTAGPAEEASSLAHQSILAARNAAYGELLSLRRHSLGRSRHEELTARRLAATDDLSRGIVAALVAPNPSRDVLEEVSAWLAAVGAAWRAGAALPPAPSGEGVLRERSRRLALALAGRPLGPPPELGVVSAGGRRGWVARARDLLPGPDGLAAAGRLALCMGAAAACMVELPGRSYWVPLTVAIVLKPDFGSVFARAVLRSAGTVIGVFIGVAILAVVPKGLWLVPVIVVLVAAMPWATQRNYALVGVLVTPFVVVLLDFATPGRTIDYGAQRLLDTVIGGAIVVLLGVLPWRGARGVDVRASFSRALTAIVAYLRAASRVPDGVPGHLPDGVGSAPRGTASSAALASARLRALRELSDLRTALQRSLSVPHRSGPSPAAWFPLVASADRLVDLVTASEERGAVPDTGALADRLGALAGRVAQAGQASLDQAGRSIEASGGAVASGGARGGGGAVGGADGRAADAADAAGAASALAAWYGHELDVELGRLVRLLQPAAP